MTTIRDMIPELRFHVVPDETGKPVSQVADARFKNKVLLVALGGSWCPNRHDEAKGVSGAARPASIATGARKAVEPMFEHSG